MDGSKGLGKAAQGLLLDDVYPFQTMPKRLTPVSSWHGHIPFAFWLVRHLEPGLIVELGVHKGDSLSAFSQAVKDTGLDARVIGIDHWHGDDHAGFYNDEVYADLQLYVSEEYPGIAELKRMSFADALAEMEDKSIDILHVDGRHGYDDAKEDFSSYIPKLSDRAVVLFHDTAVYGRGFEVYKLFKELCEDHPGRTFQFDHSHGLGVLGYGPKIPETVQALFQLDQTEASIVRDHFAAFGRLVRNEGRIDTYRASIGRLTSPVAFSETVAARDEFSLDDMITAFEERQTHLEDEMVKAKNAADKLANKIVLGQSLEGSYLKKGAWTLLFRSDGKPVKPLRRLLFHKSGKPRETFKRLVFKKDGQVRPAFKTWMLSEQYQALPRAHPVN